MGTDLHSKLQKGTNEILEASELVREQLKVLDERMACWDEIQNRIQEAKKKSNKKVVLDVGGKKFATYSSTLLKHETSYFTALLLNGEMQDVDGSYFIDRNPKYFGVLLDFLRTGTLDYEDFTEKNIDKLKDEFKFYSVPYPKPRYSFADGNTTATMLKNYLVNKGTLLESGKHSGLFVLIMLLHHLMLELYHLHILLILIEELQLHGVYERMDIAYMVKHK